MKDQRIQNSVYGRTGTRKQNSINVDLNWQPLPDSSAYITLARQESRMTQQGLQQYACVLSNACYLCSEGSQNTTSPLYPSSRSWTSTQKDSSNSFAIGARHQLCQAGCGCQLQRQTRPHRG